MTWFVLGPDGERINLPTCSPDYQPSGWMFNTCLHDPDVEICRAHREFFKRQEKKDS